MEIVIHTSDAEALAATLARIGIRLDPPCHRHPGRWTKRLSLSISVLPLRADGPPAGAYLGCSDQVMAELAAAAIGDTGVRVATIADVGEVKIVPALPTMWLRPDEGDGYAVKLVFERTADAIRAIMDRAGLSNARVAGFRHLVDLKLRSRFQGDRPFALLVDGNPDADLSELQSVLSGVGSWAPNIVAIASAELPAEVMDEIDEYAWWLDEIVPRADA